jgi:DNA-binding response OmpR family regulator
MTKDHFEADPPIPTSLKHRGTPPSHQDVPFRRPSSRFDFVSSAADTILIVEDSENDALLFSVALEEAGIRNPLFFTSTYQEAKDYFLGQGKFSDRPRYPIPRLIFLDAHMHDVSGFEVLQWLRQNDSSKGTRIAMMSGSSSDADVSRAFWMGADHFLTKPIDTQDLVETLKVLRAHLVDIDQPK